MFRERSFAHRENDWHESCFSVSQMLAPRSKMPRTRLQRARGFTLVEMMAVVVIVAILGALAAYSVRKYIMTSQTAEATEMLNSIMSAQEAYKAETFSYKDVSGLGKLDDYSTFYPANTFARVKRGWGGGTDAIANNWRELGVSTTSAVRYIYGCAAGPGTTAPDAPILPTNATIANFPTDATGQPWFVAEAVADFDGDGNKGYWIGTSLAPQIFHFHDPPVLNSTEE